MVIYFPITDSVGMWGYSNPNASTAVCLTNRYLILTRDYHDQQQPLIKRIPLEQILNIEFGSALLLGWFRCIFLSKPHQTEIVDILFNSRILPTVEELVNIWWGKLHIHSTCNLNKKLHDCTTGTISQIPVDDSPIKQLNLPVQLEGKGRQRVIRSHPIYLYLTARGLIIHTVETSVNPKEITFAERWSLWNPRILEFTLRLETSEKGIFIQFAKDGEVNFSYSVYPAKHLEEKLKNDLSECNSIFNIREGPSR